MTAREKLAEEIDGMSPGQQWALKLSIAAEHKIRHFTGPIDKSAMESAWDWALSHISHPSELKK